MENLLKKAQNNMISEGISIVHDYSAKDLNLNYIGFTAVDISEGKTYEVETKNQEVCIVVLTGKANISDNEQTFENLGRRNSIFDRVPTDSVYISRDQKVKVLAKSDVKAIVCYAPCSEQRATEVIKAEDNSVEDRGQYNNKRHVHNILPDSHKASENLLVVEVFTDQANWSSYPPHKHDEDNLPNESLLEETYYHEVNPEQGFVFQRVYTDDRSLDETMAVENRDAVIVPKGYHPVGVPDGYDGYYLNIMAGPTKVWKFNNDKDHEWIINRK